MMSKGHHTDHNIVLQACIFEIVTKIPAIIFWIWRYDEISWFANQGKAYRINWLNYAFPVHIKQTLMPISECPVAARRRLIPEHWHHANDSSIAMPDWF